MKTLYLLGVIYVALIIQGCASTKPSPSTEQPLPPTQYQQLKDPIKVSILPPEKKLGLPYQVIGKAKVSKFNTVGVKRQEATIHDIMRQLAASVNGDAVIDLHHEKTSVTATVIAYKRVMV